jgi:2-polyprenyl-6-methoxyphenol hydroxylase-like FAD-dependent oxidoreductase
MHELVEGVAVVGAGLAGLTLAATLHARNLPVEVLDAHGALPAGPERGLCLWSGALAALEPTGAVGAIAARAAPIERVQLWSARGRLLLDLSAPAEPVAGLAVRHAALMDALATACSDVPIHSGQQVVGYVEDARGVLLSCRGGWHLRAPVAIGADGALSTMRLQALDDGAALFAGDSVWQGITVGLRRLDPGVMHLFWGPAAVRAGAMAVDRSGNWAWWVDAATDRSQELALSPARSTLRALLAEMQGPMLDLIEATPEEAIVRTDVLARRTPGSPGRGRITLMGDAWHPLPVALRMGGTLAVEDAHALAETLASEPDPVAAMRAYERQRQPRVQSASDTVWAVRGLEARVSAPAVWLRDLGLRHLPPGPLRRRLARLLGGAVESPQSASRQRLRWA